MPKATVTTIESEPATKPGDTLETLKKGLALLRLFSADVPELTIQDAAERLGLSRASARRILITLSELGYVAQRGRAFHLTPEVLNLGLTYFSSQSYSKIANPILHALADEIEETTTLAVLDGFNIIHIATAEPRSPLMRISHNVGRSMPAYATSGGRVLLSGLADEDVERYLASVKPRQFTDDTKTDVASLRREILAARRKKCCLVVNELAYGIASMSVPVYDVNDKVTAALGTGMVHGRNLREMGKAYLPAMRAAAEELSEILRKCKGVPD